MPIYATLRRKGFAASDAEDLAQGFFLHLIDGNTVARADPERGRFRNFLHGALLRFLANDTERETALKRGGDRIFVPFDADAIDAQTVVEDDDLSLQLQFDRRWARALVENALAQLSAEYAASGETALFAVLQSSLSVRQVVPYAEMAEQLGRKEGAVKTAVHRLRRRFREALRKEVALTVSTTEDVEDELRYLRNVLVSESENTML